MDDPQPQLLWAAALFLIGLLALAFQAYCSVRRGAVPRVSRKVAYWSGLTAWLALGAVATAGEYRPIGVVGAWGLVIAGLLLASLLRWRSEERPPLLLEEHADQILVELPSKNGGESPTTEAALDLEDRRLLGNLLGLLGRRAAQLMIPLDSLPYLYEDDSIDRIRELFRTTRPVTQRLPVVRRADRRSVGLIDARLFLPRTTVQETPPAAGRAADFAVPLPSVNGWDPAERALESMKQGGRGVVAVVNARSRVVGYVGWPGIFRSLLGRPAREARL